MKTAAAEGHRVQGAEVGASILVFSRSPVLWPTAGAARANSSTGAYRSSGCEGALTWRNWQRPAAMRRVYRFRLPRRHRSTKEVRAAATARNRVRNFGLPLL